MSQKKHFIINPNARNAGSLKIWQQVQEVLDERKVAYDFVMTERPGHAPELAKAILAQDEEAFIIALGGDGTAHEVVNGMIGYPKAAFAFIGAGSGNDFARGAKIPLAPLEALEMILEPEPPVKSFDYGAFQSDEKGYFIASMGMGIDADVTQAVNVSRLKIRLNQLKLGKLAYLIIFLKKLFTYRMPDMTVTIDGESKAYEKVWLVNIANSKYFGGGIPISPEARIDSGVFHLLIAHSYSRWSIFVLFFSLIWGGHTSLKNVVYTTGKNIQVKTNVDKVVHADGEIVGKRKVDIQIHPVGLRVVTR